MAIAVEMGQTLGAPLAVTQAANAVFQAAVPAFTDRDFAAVADYIAASAPPSQTP